MLLRESRALMARARAAVIASRSTCDALSRRVEPPARLVRAWAFEKEAPSPPAVARPAEAPPASRDAEGPKPCSFSAPPPAEPAGQGGKIAEPLAAAVALLDLGAPDEAWEVLDQMSAAQQASPEVLALRARIFQALEMPGMAGLLTFAIQAGSPEWAHRHFLAAKALARLGLAERARELARIACAVQPDLMRAVRECTELAGLL